MNGYTPLDIEMNIRKDKLASLMYNAMQNPLIDNDKIFNLFKKFSSEVDHWKYTEDLNRLIVALQVEMNTGEGECYDFLTTYINPEQTITVYQAIYGYLF